jgi:hypothetical protein
MAELATIARPYADALFKAAQADLGQTAAWLDELATVAANPQLQAFADSPNTSGAQVLDVVKGVMKTPMGEQGSNFLKEVLANGKLCPRWRCSSAPCATRSRAWPMQWCTAHSPSMQQPSRNWPRRWKLALAANST